MHMAKEYVLETGKEKILGSATVWMLCPVKMVVNNVINSRCSLVTVYLTGVPRLVSINPKSKQYAGEKYCTTWALIVLCNHGHT